MLTYMHIHARSLSLSLFLFTLFFSLVPSHFLIQYTNLFFSLLNFLFYEGRDFPVVVPSIFAQDEWMGDYMHG